jgi:hypothetical protein
LTTATSSLKQAAATENFRSRQLDNFIVALMRLFSNLLFAYVFLSCLYTTSFLLLCPFVKDCSTSFALDVSELRASFLWTRRRLFKNLFSGPATSRRALLPTTQALVMRQAASYDNMVDFLSGLELRMTDPVLYWPVALSQSESYPWQDEMLLRGAPSAAERDWYFDGFAMSESIFLSKAFSSSMHPMKIFPYFYKGSESFEEDDITITTLVTPNRFEVLRKLASRYEGMSSWHPKMRSRTWFCVPEKKYFQAPSR